MAIPLTIDAPENDLGEGFEVIGGRESVRQRVLQRLLLFRGEWFLDTRAGVPYFDEIFTRPANVSIATSLLTSEIRAVEGVEDVFDVTVEIPDAERKLVYSCSIRTEDGDTEVTFG